MSIHQSFIVGFIFLGFSLIGLTQETHPNMNVKFTSSSIDIDGNDLEEVWKTADSTYAGWTHFPNESNDFNNPTQLKLLYDENNIYIMCKAFSVSDDYVIPSLKWDFSGRASDKINFVFDTFSDGNIAYMFGSNMAGVKSDILVSNGGVGLPINDLNRTWDAKFDVEGQTFPGYYIIEMRIPLSTLNFPKGATSWRFNFFRFDTTEFQRTTWARIPQEFKDYNLAFMGKIHFEKPLGKSNANISVIPFINAITVNGFENDKASSDISIGGDVKIPIGNGLNLDVTYNPDFSQVEVDDEIVNLRRFEIKLPRRNTYSGGGYGLGTLVGIS